MSVRSLSPTMVARIKAGIVKIVIFVYADFPGSPRRYWTGEGPITWDGHVWDGVGNVLGFDTITENTDSASKGMAVRVNGLDSDFVNDLLNTNYQGRDAIIYMGLWDHAEQDLEMMDDPLWKGILDTDQIKDEGKKASIVVRGENKMRNQLQKKEFRYTDADQHLLYPDAGDTSMNKIEQIQDVSIPWGRTQ